MADLLGYGGKRVVVTGCASGMGQATAKLLGDLGAEVHGLDFKASQIGLSRFTQVDLRDPVSIDAAVGGISGTVDALFNCAGLGPTFSPLDIVKVNFLGTRHLTEALLPKMRSGSAIASVASTAAMGWARRIPVHKTLIAIPDFAEAVAWVEAHPEQVGEGYAFSKEAVVIWTMLRAQALIGQGIRINAILPGLTQTPMMTDQIMVNTPAAMLDSVVQPSGRPGRPEEQAFFLVVANSAPASYLNGAAINVDGGRLARVSMGMVEVPARAG